MPSASRQACEPLAADGSDRRPLTARVALASDSSLHRHGAFFRYNDCASFDPIDCPAALQLNEQGVCSATSYLPELGDMGARLLKVRGALVADFGAGGGLGVYSDTAEVQLSSEAVITDDRLAALQLLPVVNAPQPANGQPLPSGKLPPPTVPSYLAYRLERTRARSAECNHRASGRKAQGRAVHGAGPFAAGSSSRIPWSD